MKKMGLAIGGLGLWLLLRKKKPPLLRRPPCGNYGDVDGDGYVTETDALWVAQYNIGQREFTEEQIRRGDVNGVGEITGVDAMIINQYAIGLIDTFPVCEG